MGDDRSTVQISFTPTNSFVKDMSFTVKGPSSILKDVQQVETDVLHSLGQFYKRGKKYSEPCQNNVLDKEEENVDGLFDPNDKEFWAQGLGPNGELPDCAGV